MTPPLVPPMAEPAVSTKTAAPPGMVTTEAVGESQSTGALREGQVGRVQGFTVVESTRIGDEEIYAFSRDAFTIAVRPPVIPAGAPFGAIESSNGFGLRYLRDYDVMHTVDRSLVSTFVGSAALPLYRVKRNYDATTATVETVPGGAALFLDTATATTP